VALVEEDRGFPEQARKAFAELREHCRVTTERIESWSGRSSRTPGMATRLGAWPRSPASADHRLADRGDGRGHHRELPERTPFRGLAGLVPRQHSSGGKTRLGRITKAGNREIRTLLVLGATSMVHRAGRWNSAAGAWVRGLLERRPVRHVTVALANKMARIAWAVMARNEVYRAVGGVAPAAAATA
jgi:error-prone DNA polymerase